MHITQELSIVVVYTLAGKTRHQFNTCPNFRLFHTSEHAENVHCRRLSSATRVTYTVAEQLLVMINNVTDIMRKY